MVRTTGKDPIGPRRGTATRDKGRQQADNILAMARRILIAEGYAGLTVRKVARQLGISLGNLTYYFPNKEALLEALIADLLDDYHRAFQSEQARFPDDPRGRFLAYLDYLIADCRQADTRAIFFQIWGLATHNGMVAQLRDGIYAAARSDARKLIAALNPAASPAELNALVGTFIAMIEGLHVVADVDDETLQLPPDFTARFRDSVYRLVVRD